MTLHPDIKAISQLQSDYQSIRAHSLKICAPLLPEDYVVQPIEDVSPPKWHLGHVTWFFENFILVPELKGYQIFDERLNWFFNSYYESERQFRDLFTAFAILAAVIGCLGLFGLSSFTAMQRTREVAIRKVLGSSVRKIVFLLSRDFLMLVGVGIVIAWPMSYFIMDNWLANYPYAVSIGMTSYIASGLIVVGVALLTITYHILKSALANPVESLKYE